jgi:hypothetical protein
VGKFHIANSEGRITGFPDQYIARLKEFLDLWPEPGMGDVRGIMIVGPKWRRETRDSNIEETAGVEGAE